MKISELARELEMTGKELTDKAKSMGLEVKTSASALSEIDEKTLRNSVLAKRKKAQETTIVKAASTKKEESTKKEPRVTVKAAKVQTKKAEEAHREAEKKVVEKKTEGRTTRKAPPGKPLPRSQKPKKPMGTPVPKKEVVKEEKPKVEVKPEPKVEAKPKPKVEVKPEPKVEAKPKPKVEVKPEPKREEKKVVKKERVEERSRAMEPVKGNREKKVSSEGKDNRGNSNKRKNEKKEKYRKDDNKAKRPVRSLEKKEKKKKMKPKPVIEPVEEVEVLPVGTKVVNVPITIAGFCEQVGVSVPNVIMTLLKMGVVANQNQNIDEVTVSAIAEELNLQIVIGSVEEEVIEEGLETFEDREKDLKSRPPIITVMGHVDHGKTSLLDAIRKTNVTEGESGGITQHIGASEVEINGEKIVFLDTPGHEAFTAMRARGADITDIAILVVAADDSVKPQTIESISHAKAAGVPIIVAINKMDKPGANPDRVKQDLTEHGIVVEEWGGDVISVPVSAKSGEGIVSLLEMILLQAEVLELRANPNRLAQGTVIEAHLDKAKGPVASVLVTNGTLKAGQAIVAGTCAGRIRLMSNHIGEPIIKATPATAVEILGLSEVPDAGDTFNAVGEDKVAKSIAEKRKIKQREEVMARNSSSTLEELFSQIQDGEVKELNVIVKGDVRGSVGAVVGSLEKLANENVKVRVVHSGVGAITESDISLAGTSGAIVIAFNVRPTAAVAAIADREKVQIRNYRVIYDIIDDIENAMKGLLDPEFKEEVLGEVEVRDTFKVPNVGIIAGGYVTSGKIIRNAEVRLLRDGIVIHEGTISSLKRFKDDAKEVAQGFECGIGIERYNDVKEGDVIQCFHMVEVERK